MTWPDGTKCYDGGWKNGNQHGNGYFINSHGTKRNGEWNEGKRTKWIGGIDADRMNDLIDNQKID